MAPRRRHLKEIDRMDEIASMGEVGKGTLQTVATTGIERDGGTGNVVEVPLETLQYCR